MDNIEKDRLARMAGHATMCLLPGERREKAKAHLESVRGRQYTEEEFDDLLLRVGLDLVCQSIGMPKQKARRIKARIRRGIGSY